MAAGKAFPFAYEQHDLSNGLRVIAVPLPWRGVASVYIIVGAGSRNEVEPGRSGFAHFFEHMMFRGTPRFPPERYEAELQRMGAASNAYTDDDRTVYHTTLASEDLEPLLEMEADRFLHLRYSEEDFRTEALAVLGEYMKDSAEPLHRLEEKLRDTAFDVHPYKHTTMGFLRDIERMPEMYDYSLQFFGRYYRPEHTTLLIAGDIRPQEALRLAERHWGSWERGSWQPDVPEEPPQNGLREARIEWRSPTLPYVVVAQKAPAYCDSGPECAALDLISLAGFSEGSELYRRLVIDEQWVEHLWANHVDHVDPYLFIVTARVKQPERLRDVRQAIEDELARFAAEPMPEDRLERVKSHLFYSFVLGLDRSESVAAALAPYIGLRRTPETVNRIFDRYAEASPADLVRVAQRYFTPQTRTVVTLEEVAQ
ncbi:MAG: insulinase family protein [Bryobacteraceae bacterium]|nr:insulinase family protein [Bryobacteraceae bacterium]